MASTIGYPTQSGAAGVLPATQRLLRVHEAAAVLGVGRSTVYELINSGALRGLRVGRSLRVATEDIEVYISALRGATE